MGTTIDDLAESFNNGHEEMENGHGEGKAVTMEGLLDAELDEDEEDDEAVEEAGSNGVSEAGIAEGSVEMERERVSDDD